MRGTGPRAISRILGPLHGFDLARSRLFSHARARRCRAGRPARSQVRPCHIQDRGGHRDHLPRVGAEGGRADVLRPGREKGRPRPVRQAPARARGQGADARPEAFRYTGFTSRKRAGRRARLPGALTSEPREEGFMGYPAATARAFQYGLFIFTLTALLGLANATQLFGALDRNTLLTHLHSGTLGWITMGVIGLSIWIFGGSGATLARNVMLSAI